MPQAQTGNGLGRMVAGAALGLVAGLALPRARKLAMQGSTLAAGDWLDALKAEHRLIEKQFRKLLETNEENMIKRELLLTRIAYALNKHAIEEENVIYPALSEGGFAEHARRLAEEHLQIKTFIYDLRRISSKDPQWIVKAREFWDLVQHHVREEEDEVFPAFRDTLSREESRKLTVMLNWEGLKVA